MNFKKPLLALFITALTFLSPNAPTEAALPQSGAAAKARLHKTYGKLPLSFIQNDGQMDEAVKFYERGNGRTTFFTKEGMTLVLTSSQRKGFRRKAKSQAEISEKFSEVVRLIPLGASKDPEIVAEGKRKGVVDVFIGNDPAEWQTSIPTYRAVLYKALYPNIDLRFYGNNRQFEYDVIVKPGADPSTVRLAYEGVEGLDVAKNGALEIALKTGMLVQKKPYIYQEINGERVEVDGKFVLLDQKNDPPHTFGFEVASYDKTRVLAIDPVLVFSAYLGGDGNDAVSGGFATITGIAGGGIAVDGAGNIYIAGSTSSDNFPGTSPESVQEFRAGLNSFSDVFVAKVTPDGSSVLYSTYLGGNFFDNPGGIVVDDAGNAYLAGATSASASNFPTTASAIGPCDLATFDNTFVTKIGPTGGLVYSTCLGFAAFDVGSGIAVDGSGRAYVVGRRAGGAFVAKISTDGGGIIYTKA